MNPVCLFDHKIQFSIAETYFSKGEVGDTNSTEMYEVNNVVFFLVN